MIYSGATIVIAFVTTPLLWRWLGSERFGAWRAVADWFGHLSLLELGLGGALAPLIALAIGRRDPAAVRRTVAEGVRAYTRVAAMALFAGLILVVFIPRLVVVHPDTVGDLRRGAAIALVMVLLYPFSTFRIFADASQRGWVVNYTLLAQSLIVTLLALALAWRGYGMTGQFFALLIGQMVFVSILVRDGLKREPGLLREARSGAPDAATRAEIRKLNLPTFLFDLSGRAGLLTDNIVIAFVLGANNVAPLFLTQRLASLAQSQLQGVGTASWAALGELHGLGRHDVFNARLLQLTRLVTALGVAVLVPIAAHNRAFIALWIGAEQYGGDLVTTLAAVNALLLAIVSLWGWCFSGTGKIALMTPVMLVGAALNLGISIAAAYRVGLAGPLIGTSVAIVSTTLWYLPLQLQRQFGTPLGGTARAVIMPLLWAALPSAGIIWLAYHYPPLTWVALAGRMALSFAVLFSVWWFGELDDAERGTYRERVRLALGR